MLKPILRDPSKAYDCIPHSLLIAKIEAYGLEIVLSLYHINLVRENKELVLVIVNSGIISVTHLKDQL